MGRCFHHSARTGYSCKQRAASALADLRELAPISYSSFNLIQILSPHHCNQNTAMETPVHIPGSTDRLSLMRCAGKHIIDSVRPLFNRDSDVDSPIIENVNDVTVQWDPVCPPPV